MHFCVLQSNRIELAKVFVKIDYLHVVTTGCILNELPY